MSSVNKTITVGRLGRDPETREFDNGSVTKFSIATSEKYKKEGEMVEDTQWHNIVCWGKLADITAKYLTKGRQVYVEGKLKTRSWETDSGEKRYATDIIATNVQFLGGSDDVVKPAEDKIEKVDTKSLPNHAPQKADLFDSNEPMPF